MSAYSIHHGNIAACCTVTTVTGEEINLIYESASRCPVTLTRGDEEAAFKALPLKVREAVNRQFSEVFSLPLEQRGDWVKAQNPFLVWTDDV